MTGSQANAPHGDVGQRSQPLPAHYIPTTALLGPPTRAGDPVGVGPTGVPAKAQCAASPPMGAAPAPLPAEAVPLVQPGSPHTPFAPPDMPRGGLKTPAPGGTRVTFRKGRGILVLNIPSAGQAQSEGLSIITFAIVGMVAITAIFIIFLHQTSSITPPFEPPMGPPIEPPDWPPPDPPGLHSLGHVSIAFYLMGMSTGILFLLAGCAHACHNEVLAIAGGKFTLKRVGLSVTVVTGQCWRVSGVSIKVKQHYHRGNGSMDTTEGRATTHCVIHEGVQEHEFGQFLTPIEQHWILGKLARALNVPVLPMSCNV